MKAILEYDLPEERIEHLTAIQSGELSYALNEILNQLREWQKHGHEFKTADEALDSIRKFAIDSTDGLEEVLNG